MDSDGAVDISGNGHNGLSSVGTVSYGVASLSSKVPANQATALTNGGNIIFTPPQTALTDPTKPWALADTRGWASGSTHSRPTSMPGTSFVPRSTSWSATSASS